MVVRVIAHQPAKTYEPNVLIAWNDGVPSTNRGHEYARSEA
jgi:hypothetical protein